MISEKSAGTVVFRRNETLEYLVLHYGAGHWDFPKGHIEPSETERETALRELEEETGIKDTRFVEGFRSRIEYMYRKAGQMAQKEVIFYLVETKGGDVKLSREHVGYEWLEFEEAVEKVTYDTAKHVLKNANNFLKQSRLGWF